MTPYPHRTPPVRRLTSLASATLLLAACGGGGSGGGGTSGLDGIAAVGAPVVGATVSARCADGKTYSTPTISPTSDSGHWTMKDVPANAPPCAIRTSGGKVGDAAGADAPDLYSYAASLGRVNITTLTQLVVAHASGQAPSDWYNAFTSGSSIATTDLNATLAAFAGKGYDDNPLTVSFTADGTGHDALLDRLPAGDAYETLVADASAGALDDLPSAEKTPDTPEAPSNIAVLSAFAGSYTVSGSATDHTADRGTATRAHSRGTISISTAGDVDFDTGIAFTATQIQAIYDRRSLCDLAPPANTAACRIHVNLDADDSGRKLELFLAPDKTAVLEIRYQDGQGGITRAAIQDAEPEAPVEPGNALPTDKAGIITMVKGFAGTYDLLSERVNGNLSITPEERERGLFTLTYSNVCPGPLGIGSSDLVNQPQLTPVNAELRITTDGKVRVLNTQDSSKYIEVDPASADAAINRRAENAGMPGWQQAGLVTYQYNIRDMAGALYERGTYYGFYLGVDADGKLRRIDAGVAGLTPSCSIDFKLLDSVEKQVLANPLAELKALAGSHAVRHTVRGTTPAWQTVSIGTDGGISFSGGTGPALTPTQISHVQRYYREDTGSHEASALPAADKSLWALRVYANRDLNSDGKTDRHDHLTLFMNDNGNGLRDLQYPVSAGTIGEVSFADVSLPAADPAHKTAITGSGISVSISGKTYRVDGDTDKAILTPQFAGGMRMHIVNVGNTNKLDWNVNFGISGTPLSTNTAYVCPSGLLSFVSTPVSELGQMDVISASSGRCAIELDSFTQQPGGRVDAAAGSIRAVLFDKTTRTYVPVSGYFQYSRP